MKRQIIGFLVIASFFAAMSIKAYSQYANDDDMEMIKSFKPDDKYFKASLVALHFITETSPIERVDTV